MVGLQASSDVPTHCSTVRWQSRHPRRRAVAMAVRVPRHNGACRTRQRAPSLPALVLAAHRTGHCMVKLGHALQQWRSCWVAAGSASTQLNTAHRLGIHSAQRRFASARTLPQLATDLLGGSRLPRSVLFSAWACTMARTPPQLAPERALRLAADSACTWLAAGVMRVHTRRRDSRWIHGSLAAVLGSMCALRQRTHAIAARTAGSQQSWNLL